MGVTHLAHVEIGCPDLDASSAFFTDILGMQVSAATADSVYLRCWGDWPHHTLTLTHAEEPGVLHVGWAVADAADLDAGKRLLDARGVPSWRVDDEPGQGPALRFAGPGGHVHELVHDLQRTAVADSTSILPNQSLPLRGRGIEPRRIDHVNLESPDVGADSQFVQEVLGVKLRERIQDAQGEVGHWLSATPLPHDIAIMRGPRGGLHHVAFWVDTRTMLLRAADLYVEHGVRVECGPGRHAVSQALYLYCFEPSGNRVELFSGGYLAFEADFETIPWTTESKDRIELAMTGHRVRDLLAGAAGAVEG